MCGVAGVACSAVVWPVTSGFSCFQVQSVTHLSCAYVLLSYACCTYVASEVALGIGGSCTLAARCCKLLLYVAVTVLLQALWDTCAGLSHHMASHGMAVAGSGTCGTCAAQLQ